MKEGHCNSCCCLRKSIMIRLLYPYCQYNNTLTIAANLIKKVREKINFNFNCILSACVLRKNLRILFFKSPTFVATITMHTFVKNIFMCALFKNSLVPAAGASPYEKHFGTKIVSHTLGGSYHVQTM